MPPVVLTYLGRGPPVAAHDRDELVNERVASVHSAQWNGDRPTTAEAKLVVPRRTAGTVDRCQASHIGPADDLGLAVAQVDQALGVDEVRAGAERQRADGE